VEGPGVPDVLDLLFGVLTLEMNLPPTSLAEPPTCLCYHPHGECVGCGCPLLAIDPDPNPAPIVRAARARGGSR